MSDEKEDDWKGPDGNVNKEALFKRRIEELTSRHGLSPWQAEDIPEFQIPVADSKLYADREVEGAGLDAAEIEKLALTDFASRTFNFKSFFKRLNYELKRGKRYKRDLSLLLIGIDDWSELITTYGAEAADAIIAQVAKAILASIRDVDIPGRCREDAFGIILPETPQLGAEVAAERIRTQLENVLVLYTYKAFAITVSVGISSYPNCKGEVDELFGKAAGALLKVMSSGGNRIACSE